MMKKILVIVALLGIFSFSAPALAATSLIDKAQLGDCYAVGNCTPCDLIQVGVNASDMIVAFSGAVALLMLIAGGLLMITAYGSDRINLGRTTVLAAVFGILIIFSAWLIVNTFILLFYGGNAGQFGNALGAMTGGGKDWQTYNCAAAPAATPPAK